MVDQLALNITTPGSDAAITALRNVQAAAQQVASQAGSLSGALGQASAATDQHTEAITRSMHAYLSLGTVVGNLPGPLGALGHAFGAIHTSITDAQAATLGLGAALSGLGLTLGSALGGAVGEAIHFQEQMGILRATLPVADVEQFGGALTDLAQKLGRDTVFSSTQAIEGMGALARAGLSTGDILGGVAKSALDMAAAMGTSPTVAARVLGAALREFNLTAADAPHVADLFSQAVHVAGLSAESLANGLSKVGPMIRAMGGTLEDAVTGIELLTRSGIEGGRAGTMLAQVYQDIVNPRTAAAAKVMQDLGFITAETGNKFVNEAGQVRPFVEVAQILSEGLSRLTPQQEALATQTEFSRRAMLGAMIIANQYATGGLAALTDAQQQARTAAEAMAERLNNLWGATKQLSSSVQTLAVDIGGALTPAIRPAVEGLKGMVDRFTELGPQAHTTIAAVAGVEAAVLTLSGVLVTISTVAPLVATALAGVGISLTAILGPIGLIAVASGVLAAAWVNDWGGIQEVVLPALADLRSDLELTTTYITGVTVPAVQKAGGDIREALVQAFTGVGAAIQESLARELPGGVVGQFIAKGVEQDRQVVVDAATATGIDFGQALKEAYIASLGGGLLVGVKALFDLVRPGMQDAVAELPAAVEPAAEAAWVQAAGEQARAYVAKFQQSTEGLMLQFLADSKGNFGKAIQEALGLGMQEVAAGLMVEQDQIKVINDAIKNLSAARRAEILEIKTQQGVEAALLHVYDSGLITEEQYKNALEGIAESHKKAKTAAEEHKAALAAMAQSTDVAAVAQGLFSQHLDAFIEKNARLLPGIEAQVVAYVNAGKTMEALRVEADALGLSEQTLIDAVQGNVKAQEQVKAALDQVTGSHKTATAALKDHRQELALMVASTDAATVAQGLFAQSITSTITTALSKSTIEVRANVQALLNQGDTFHALQAAAAGAGVSFETLTRAIEGDARAQAQLQEGLKRTTEEMLRQSGAANSAARVGIEVSQGVGAGILAGAPAAQQSMQEAMRGVVVAGRQAIAAESPSRVTAEQIGRPMAEGVGAGFTQAMPGVQAQIATALDGVVASVGDYGRKAAGAFDASLMFSGGGDQTSAASPGGPWGAAGMQAYQTLASRFSQYLPFSSFGMGPEGRAVDVAKQAQAFQDALKSIWENQYGTSDPAKAQAAYQATLPAGTQSSIIYQNLQNQAASSLFQSLIGKLPLAGQASYMQMAQGGPEALMAALQQFWGAGGGSSEALYNKLNNIQGPSSFNLSPAELHPELIGRGGGGTGGGGGSLTGGGNSGSGFAQAPLSFAQNFGTVGDQLVRGQGGLQDIAFSVQQSNAAMQAWAVALRTNAFTIASIPQAFSAYALTPTPGLGNTAVNTGGSGAFQVQGNTPGGANFGALQALAAQITAQHPDLSADSQARLIQQGMRTNTDYLRVVGHLADTGDDLRRQQEDAANQVFNWSNVVNMGIPAAQELADAQAHLTAITNQLASTVTAPTPSVTTPQTPKTPVPTTSQLANLQPGQFYTLNSAGELVISTAQNLSAGVGLPHLAAGGIVTAPTLALVGERGPEAVVPLGRSGGSVTINLTYNASGGGAGNATDMAAFVRQFREEARRQGVDMSRLGGL